MRKVHINDTDLFKLLAITHGGYKALSWSYKYFKEEAKCNGK